jgi:hypothetical protein
MTARYALARLFPVALLAALSACFTSRPPGQVAREDSQRGAGGWIRLTDGTIHGGELLALEDVYVVMLTADRVAVAPRAVVRGAEFGRFKAEDLRTLTSAVVDRGRRASRFPYGITSAAMAELLAVTKQQQPDTLSVARR